jgi:nucleoside-diphosphate-sugar epimerase
MTNYLITGATGYTGGHLARRLAAAGHRVRGLVRGSSQTAALTSAGVECVVANLTDAAAVRRAVAGADAVFHLAAAYREEHADRRVFTAVNVEGTRTLLEASAAAGVGRFVHCSTVGVQGQIDDPPATEEYRVQPGDHYQESKLAGERLALEHAAAGRPVTVIRPVGIYGPGDTRFLKLFRGIARGRFVMIGRGEVLYHLTYIDDLIDGFLLAAEHPAALGEVFTIAGARWTTLNELVARIAATLDRKPARLRMPYAPVHAASLVVERVCGVLGVRAPLYPRRVEFFSKDRAFDITKARQLLGYAPRVDLDEGLSRTTAWYRQQGLL